MKKQHLIFINLAFFGLILFSAGVVYEFLTGNQPLAIFSYFNKEKAVSVSTGNCSDKPAIPHLHDAKNPQLQVLASYQDACHSAATDTVMVFVGMPVSPQNAADMADILATELKEFAKYGVRPLIIAEPTDSNGTNLDFAELAGGAFNPSFDAYFARLKSLGITDQQMGIWNPFPEANLPYWNNNQPSYFAPAVNHYVRVLRTYFPGAQTSILLNSATYQTTDFDWANGEYLSLLPYIKGITPGSITYAGLQGFPWAPPQGGVGAILNAAEFLNPTLLSEMADYLKIKHVWYNTATFSTKYTLDAERTVYITPEQRKDILGTVLAQAESLQKKGYSVSINLFSEDKSKTPEATNWSYWPKNKPFNSLSAPVFTDFVSELNQQKIPFWLFDR